MSGSICLNADLGELPRAEGRSVDAALLRIVSRCNIACGAHAGDEATMRETVRRAKALGVQIGAHPSYPDRENFGRRVIELDQAELRGSLTEQVKALMAIARSEGAGVRHLKPHGALYNAAAVDAVLAGNVVSVALDCGIAELVGPPNSELETATRESGLVFVAEGFADRLYEQDGSLTPRAIVGSVIEDAQRVALQARTLAQSGRVRTRQGGEIDMLVRTLCLHSDTPRAAELAAAIRASLESSGLEIAV